ncbi:MAG: TlpA disulfide reductase family protein [bacterium]
MKNLIYLILIITLSYSCSEKDKTIKEVLNDVYEKYSISKSISYDIDYKMKYLNKDDTISIEAKCKLIRDTSDTLFNGFVWHETSDSTELYYDLKKIYSIYHAKKTITEYDAHKGQSWAMTGTVSGDIKDVFFLNIEKLKSILNDTTAKIHMAKATVNNMDYWRVTIKYPDDGDMTDMRKILLINRDEDVIEKISFKVKFQGNYQYTEWSLKNVKFDVVEKDYIKNRVKKFSKAYKYEVYKEEKYVEPELLKNGAHAPDFSGEIYPTGKESNLSDYKGKVVILDFWYMSCFWCIKAIPHMNELYKKYKDKGLIVLGVNSKNNNEKDKHKIPNFLKHNEMSYPIIFTDNTPDSLYLVSGYPTIYMMDKKGKIVFSQAGFSENLKDTLNIILKKLLR